MTTIRKKEKYTEEEKGGFWGKKKRKQQGENYRQSGQDFIRILKDIVYRQKGTDDEYLKEFMELKKTEGGTEGRKVRYTPAEIRSFLYAAAVLLNIMLLVSRYIAAFIHMQPVIVTNNPFLIGIGITAPFVAWIWSTNENFWAFHQRKRTYFYAVCLNMILILIQPVYTFLRNITVKTVFKLPTNPVFTPSMVLLLGYIVLGFQISIIIILVANQLIPVLFGHATKRSIELFKLSHLWDNRKDKEYRYDIKCIRNLETGSSIHIKENDRFLQGVINGASGTGKTSSTFISTILDDLRQKAKNREKRQKEMLTMILHGKATIQGHFPESMEENMLLLFDENSIVPVGKTKAEFKRNEKELDKIRKKYSDCGMTIVAPNPSMMRDIIRIAQALQIRVNVVDPVYSYQEYENVKEVAINPFYLPFDLEESERVIRIMEASSVFSDVLIATNQMNGDGDTYFTDISLSVSTNVAAIVMLAKNIEGKQASIDDIHECISNFSNLRPYVDIIEREFGINVKISEMGQNNRGNVKLDADDILNSINTEKTKETLKREKLAKKNPYYQQILFVKQELLGPGAEKMFDQERGLRNLVNKVLQDPRIKKKLSAADEDRLDFDKILSGNEITVVSTAIELGQSTSTSFGLFFLLSHKAAVLRRPEKTRTPHFLWVDEAAQYVHPFYDDVIALYRQYRVAAMLALQTLTQLEKRKSTAYLKSVFMGAGTHIVFGRLAPDEMKLYSEMGGIDREEQEQKSVTTNSILSTNPSYSQSVRTTPTIANKMEGADLRIRDFQEITIFTVDNGRVLPGQLARVFFIGPDAFNRPKLKTFLWNRAVPEAFGEVKKEEEEKKHPDIPHQEEFSDKIPKQDEVDILIQKQPKEEAITEKEEQDRMRNHIYAMLQGSQSSEK